ncbi:hypothetical protein DD869_01010 [Staphylococcus pseudintermedius]|nr:hypothetical protein DD869_01010 [Staphylococcus pseudintermedius]
MTHIDGCFVVQKLEHYELMNLIIASRVITSFGLQFTKGLPQLPQHFCMIVKQMRGSRDIPEEKYYFVKG